MKTKWLLGTILSLGMLAAQPVNAGPSDNSLVWVSEAMPSSIDSYQHTVREGFILAQHIWDTLLYKSSETGKLEPHLAESFRYIDDTTLEFVLRKGVLFHDGTELTADDVVGTVDYITKNRTALPYRFLDRAEKVDKYTVRLYTNGVLPQIQEYLAGMMPIYPAAYYAKVGPDGMSRQPIGTGPYRVVEHRPGESVKMEAFADYFGGAKKKAEIKTLEFRRISEFNTQAIELMNGGIDWIWQVPADSMQQMASLPNIETGSAETIRVGFLRLDAAGRTGDTPLKDVRVRRAINHAIDREGIRAAFMGEGSRLIDSPCSPLQFGCVNEEIVPYAYDPEKARSLLAEAGYPDGFSIQFWGFRDRPMLEAILGNLSDVGIKASLNFVQASALATERQEGRTPLFMLTWGSWSIADTSASAIGQQFNGGNEDYSRDQEVIDLFAKTNTIDTDARLSAFGALTKRIADEAYTVPMFTYAIRYAHRSGLEFSLSADETPRFFEAKWKQ